MVVTRGRHASLLAVAEGEGAGAGEVGAGARRRRRRGTHPHNNGGGDERAVGAEVAVGWARGRGYIHRTGTRAEGRGTGAVAFRVRGRGQGRGGDAGGRDRDGASGLRMGCTRPSVTRSHPAFFLARDLRSWQGHGAALLLALLACNASSYARCSSFELVSATVSSISSMRKTIWPGGRRRECARLVLCILLAGCVSHRDYIALVKRSCC